MRLSKFLMRRIIHSAVIFFVLFLFYHITKWWIAIYYCVLQEIWPERWCNSILDAKLISESLLLRSHFKAIAGNPDVHWAVFFHRLAVIWIDDSGKFVKIVFLAQKSLTIFKTASLIFSPLSISHIKFINCFGDWLIWHRPLAHIFNTVYCHLIQANHVYFHSTQYCQPLN